MYIFKAKIKLIYVTVPPFPRPYVIMVVGKYSEGRDYPKKQGYTKNTNTLVSDTNAIRIAIFGYPCIIEECKCDI